MSFPTLLLSVCHVILTVLISLMCYLALTQPKVFVPTVVCELVEGSHTCALLTPAGETLVLK